MKISESEFKLGRDFSLRISTLISNNARRLPQTFSGYLFKLENIKKMNLLVTLCV